MISFPDLPSPAGFVRGQCVRLRDEPVRYGVIVRAGNLADEWLVAFANGERAVYRTAQLELFAPTTRQRDAVDAML